MSLNLEPLLIVFALIGISFLTGLPAGRYFLKGQPRRDDPYQLYYTSTVLGFSLLHLAIFLAMQLLSTGTQPVATITLSILLVAGGSFALLKKNELANQFSCAYKPLILFLLALPLATVHIMLPVILGRWEMAYATGDDASRWYMVVDYFQNNSFEYMKTAEETLRWGMRERPLQNISGAMIASIFPTTPAIAYCVSSSMASIMAASAFCLLLESLIDIKKNSVRYMVWGIVVLFFGVFGSMANIFYTGRTTHHFSIYPVLASLAFILIKSGGLQRLVWFSLWAVLLALFYSVRFSWSFVTLAGFILLVQWIAKEIDFKAFVKNISALFLGLAVSCAAAWGEVKVIIDSLQTHGTFFLFLQRDPSYGAEGTAVDRLFKWSGMLGTYETAEPFSIHIKVMFAIGIAVIILLSLYWSFKNFRSQSWYAGLLIFSILSAASLFWTQNYYVAWKSAFYWPSYVLLGLFAFSFQLIQEGNKSGQRFGRFILAGTCGLILLSSRQIKMYGEMVDERYTKVDSTSYRLTHVAKEYLDNSTMNENKTVFGFDYSAERHLLLREVFRDFDWQPIRGKELWFEHDIIKKNPDSFDDYKYGLLLYARTFKCEPFDFSANSNAELFTSGPFTLYKAESSFPEFRKGIEMRIYGYDEERRCPMYGGELTDDTSTVVFVNNGRHDWFELTIRGLNNENEDLEKKLIVQMEERQPRLGLTLVRKDKDTAEYILKVNNLRKERIKKIQLVRSNLGGRVLIVNSRWGY